jgi:hypothetical protein
MGDMVAGRNNWTSTRDLCSHDGAASPPCPASAYGKRTVRTNRGASARAAGTPRSTLRCSDAAFRADRARHLWRHSGSVLPRQMTIVPAVVYCNSTLFCNGSHHDARRGTCRTYERASQGHGHKIRIDMSEISIMLFSMSADMLSSAEAADASRFVLASALGVWR